MRTYIFGSKCEMMVSGGDPSEVIGFTKMVAKFLDWWPLWLSRLLDASDNFFFLV